MQINVISLTNIAGESPEYPILQTTEGHPGKLKQTFLHILQWIQPVCGFRILLFSSSYYIELYI